MEYMIVIGRPEARPKRRPGCRTIGPFADKTKAETYAATFFKRRLFAIVPVEVPMAKPQFWNIPSESDPANVEYIVRLDPQGKWTCQCKDHMFRNRDCKHILQAQQEFYSTTPV